MSNQLPPILRFKFYSSTNFKQMNTFTTNQSFSENMHIPQRDVATAEEANLALSSLQKVLSDTTPPKKLIRNALIPVFSIRWGAQVIRRVTRDRLCRVLCSLRNSKLDSDTYRKISLLRHTSSETETDFPQAWTEWRATIERFNLDDEFKISEWIEVIDTFAKLGWDPPTKLALVSPTQLRTALEGHSKGTAAIQLWTDAVLLFADLSSASFIVLNGASENAEKFLHRLKSDQLCANAARSDIKTALSKSKISKLPINFDQLGPSAKLKILLRANLPLYKVDRFFRTASQSVASTGIQRCFESFASGIRCYYSFCEIKGTPPPSQCGNGRSSSGARSSNPANALTITWDT